MPEDRYRCQRWSLESFPSYAEGASRLSVRIKVFEPTQFLAAHL